MIIIIFVLIVGLTLIPAVADAQKVGDYLKPSVIQLQYAGNYGFMSVGVGQSFNKNTFTSFLVLGYLPENINGVEVKTLALKNIVNMKQFGIGHNQLAFYTGASIIYYDAHNTYTSFPKYFPKSYYDFPTALHAAPVFGASLLLKKNDTDKKGEISIFGEFSTLDYYLINFFRNRSMNFFELWNLGLGIAWHFR